MHSPLLTLANVSNSRMFVLLSASGFSGEPFQFWIWAAAAAALGPGDLFWYLSQSLLNF